MIKLNRTVEMLENLQVRLEEKIDELQAKMDEIEELAEDAGRDMTAREVARYERFEEQRDELQGEFDDIDNALDYLRDYAD